MKKLVSFDLASVITPWNRFANSIFCSRIIDNKAEKNNLKMLDEDMLPLTRFLNHDLIKNSTYLSMKKNWVNQMLGLPGTNKNLTDISYMFNNLKTSQESYTRELKDMIQSYSYNEEMYQFCDKPNANMTIDYVINQLSYPMHYVTKICKRYKYKAKETQMYTDVNFFDDCRYIYEWLPTIDLINNALENESQQLVFRFALDGLVKNRMWYNTEYFYGSSVVSVHDSNKFKDLILSRRIEVDEGLRGGDLLYRKHTNWYRNSTISLLKNKKIEIIDGRQRYETIKNFIDKKLTLSKKGLTSLHQFSKYNFDSFDSEVKNLFLNTH